MLRLLWIILGREGLLLVLLRRRESSMLNLGFSLFLTFFFLNLIYSDPSQFYLIGMLKIFFRKKCFLMLGLENIVRQRKLTILGRFSVNSKSIFEVVVVVHSKRILLGTYQVYHPPASVVCNWPKG